MEIRRFVGACGLVVVGLSAYALGGCAADTTEGEESTGESSDAVRAGTCDGGNHQGTFAYCEGKVRVACQKKTEGGKVVWAKYTTTCGGDCKATGNNAECTNAALPSNSANKCSAGDKPKWVLTGTRCYEQLCYQGYYQNSGKNVTAPDVTGSGSSATYSCASLNK